MRERLKICASLLLVVLLVLGAVPGVGSLGSRTAFAADFAEGSGTISDPYLIATAGQLHNVRYHLGDAFKLTGDIDLSGYAAGSGWTPIGTGGSSATVFSGSLDGNGHVIRHLKINLPGTEYVGLFGATSAESKIKNIRLEDVDITGGGYTGSLVGRALGVIEGSSASGRVVGEDRVGGLAGTLSGRMSDSFAVVDVTGDKIIGGLVGFGTGGTISDSFAAGDVAGNRGVGGLVGRVETITISDSFAGGHVSGKNAGGLAGESSETEAVAIERSYANGKVSNEAGNVGFIPNSPVLTVTDSFYDKDTTGHSDIGGGIGLTTAHMKDLDTYANAGWEIGTTWAMDAVSNDGYPYLKNLFTLTVRYDKGGADVSGSAHPDQRYAPGAVAKAAGQESLAKAGYTLMGWNTMEDGSGMTYLPGDDFPVATNMTLYAIWESANAALADLGSDQGTWAAAYSPTDSSGASYTIHVDHGVTSLKLYVEKAESSQSVTVTNAAYTLSDDLAQTYTVSNLDVGANVVLIEVTAPDHITGHAYTVVVNRAASDNADLSSLVLSDGELDPVFAPDITEYTAKVAYGTTGITVTASTYDAASGLSTVSIDGAAATAGTQSAVISLHTGHNNIDIIVTAQDGSTKTYRLDVQRASPDDSSGGSSPSDDRSFRMLVNGIPLDIGTAVEDTAPNGQTRLTIAIDSGKLEAVLDREGAHSIVTLPVSAPYGQIVAMINGEIVGKMRLLDTVLDIRTDSVAYTLSVRQLNFDEAMNELGARDLNEFNLEVHLSNLTDDQAKAEADQAKKAGLTTLVPPMTFSIVATDGQRSVEITRFNAYQKRTFAIPEGIDPDNITTGVVWMPDETFRHVPTKVTEQDGEYDAEIHSLTNSTYTVVGHTASFEDLSRHWSKSIVDEMASRLIVSGKSARDYDPDGIVTRAEFAAMLERALGLTEYRQRSSFKDVFSASWYDEAIAIGEEYGLISGFGDGTFRPNGQIARQEAMVMLARAMRLAGLSTTFTNHQIAQALSAFQDGTEVSVWAREAAAACIQSTAVVGSNGQLYPHNHLTRAEAAAMMAGMLKAVHLI